MVIGVLVEHEKRVATCQSKPARASPAADALASATPSQTFKTLLNAITPPSTALFSNAAVVGRDKRWHFIFTVLSTWHLFLLAFGAFAAHRQRVEDGSEGTGGRGFEIDWQNPPRLAMLGAHALRPIMLISNLQTTRRVFTNVLRQVC